MKTYAMAVGLIVALVLASAGIIASVVTSEHLAAQSRAYAKEQAALRSQIHSLRSALTAAQTPKHTGISAQIAHMGLCVGFDSTTGGIGSIAPATVMSGVPSCPSGSFVSVVPQG